MMPTPILRTKMPPTIFRHGKHVDEGLDGYRDYSDQIFDQELVQFLKRN